MPATRAFSSMIVSRVSCELMERRPSSVLLAAFFRETRKATSAPRMPPAANPPIVPPAIAPVLTGDEAEEVEAEEVEVVEPEVVVLFLTLKMVSGTSRWCTWIGDDIIHQERDRHTEQILRNSLGGGGVERPTGCNGIGERPAGERRVVGHDARDVSAEKIQVSLRGSSCMLCAHATLVCDRQCEVQSSHLTYGQRCLQFRRKARLLTRPMCW